MLTHRSMHRMHSVDFLHLSFPVAGFVGIAVDVFVVVADDIDETVAAGAVVVGIVVGGAGAGGTDDAGHTFAEPELDDCHERPAAFRFLSDVPGY